MSRRYICLDDESDEESQWLPVLTIEEKHFPVSLFGHKFEMDRMQDSNFQQLIRNFDCLETYCDAPYESFYESTAGCSIDMSIEDAIHFPQKISTRLPIQINCTNLQLTLRNLKKVWCRHVSHYFEWIGGVPDLRLMDVRGKISLVARQLSKVIFLTFAFWTFRHGHQGLWLGGGICFSDDENQDAVTKNESTDNPLVVALPVMVKRLVRECERRKALRNIFAVFTTASHIRNFVSPLATSLQAHVISTFQRIDVTREEYLLLKLIALFEVLDMRFLPNDRFIMEEALTKYRSALVFHIKHSHPELHHEAVVERVSELLGVLTYLESVTEFDNVHMADIIRRNKGNMRGRLTAEVHVQKTQHQ